MCHSVGVSFTSEPLRCTRFVTKSTVKSGVVTTGSSRARRNPAQGGTQPREELAHAERLRDVVVGARVERGDLVALGFARGEDHDRHLGPTAETGDHVETGDVGESEVEDDEIGAVAGRELQRDLAGTGRVDVVAAGAEVGDERAQDLGFVVDDEHSGHDVSAFSVTIAVVPPPGVSSSSSSPPIAVTKPRATARPRPTPVPRSTSPSRWNGSKTRCCSDAGIPGPRSTIRRWITSCTAPASTRTGASSGDHLQRVLDEVGDDAFEERGVGSHGGEGLGHIGYHGTGPFAEARERGGNDLLQMHRSQEWFDHAGLEPAHVQQVADEGVQAVGFVLDRCEELGDVLVTPLDVRLAQAGHRRLDRRERGPEVMGHGLQQRGARTRSPGPVRSRSRPARRGGARSRADGQLRGERVEHLTIVGAEARADQGEDNSVADLFHCVRTVRAGRNGCTVRGFDFPMAVGTAQHRGRVQSERRT